MAASTIEESVLGTAPCGVYVVERNGSRVVRVGDYYDIMTNQFRRDIKQVLMAKACDPMPDGELPRGAEYVRIRHDGKLLIKNYLPEEDV